ncbi:MAG: chromosome segregation protein [Planctomycetaceae bacterium]|nr:chromosome segregation protein [Planctomycetaceae bacterium]
MYRIRDLLIITAALGGLPPTVAVASEIDFNRDIRPILSENCYHCHGPDQAERQADLRLDQREGVEASGAVVPGHPEESLLIERIISDDPEERMPPPESKLSLTDEEIRLLRQWVEEGGTWSEHWSLEPINRPTLPRSSHDKEGRNPIDRFVFARLEENGLSPSAEASPERLLRRVSLDLTGLPPTPEHVKAFLDDPSPAAYEHAVDRLLGSSQYGERMAWNWLDAARYADSNGFQGDPERTMWPWRDWVVDALNANLPFDQFTRQQIAGDLVPDATLATKIATGFNRNNMHNGEGGRISEESRVENVMDRAETVATVWLGLTMTCCRCHDHKYDPLSAEDYYRFYAFFNNTSETGAGRSGQMSPTVTFETPQDVQQRARLQKEIERAIVPVARWESETGIIKNKGKERPEEIANILNQPIAERDRGKLQILAEFFQASNKDYAADIKSLAERVGARQQFLNQLPKVMVMDTREKTRETFMLTGGIYDKPGQSVTPGVPESLPALPPEVPVDRLGLAEWLLMEENPLTARVIVNRDWQLFFGKGLVTTPEDFGTQGQRPTHPALLDWLASDFRRSGWNVKRLHRMIVTSATYRQSSRMTAAQREADPDNRWLARGPRYRLPSWMLRDQALAVSGTLVARRGGPSVKPYQPENIWREATFGKKKYVPDTGEKLYRRSLYTFWRRIVGPTMFFDTSRRQTCHVAGSVTNTPLHALTTLNDVTFVEAARGLAAWVMQDAPAKPESQLANAFERATARKPTPQELQLLTERYRVVYDMFAEQPEDAIQLLEVGDSPRNEALDPIAHASCTAICSLILNLDETLTKE